MEGEALALVPAIVLGEEELVVELGIRDVANLVDVVDEVAA